MCSKPSVAKQLKSRKSLLERPTGHHGSASRGSEKEPLPRWPACGLRRSRWPRPVPAPARVSAHNSPRLSPRSPSHRKQVGGPFPAVWRSSGNGDQSSFEERTRRCQWSTRSQLASDETELWTPEKVPGFRRHALRAPGRMGEPARLVCSTAGMTSRSCPRSWSSGGAQNDRTSPFPAGCNAPAGSS